MDIIKVFEEYNSLGFMPIPLAKFSKRPIFKAWNKNYSFQRTISFLKNTPDNYNIGILLGKVIDVEGDSEEANEFLDDLFKNIKHPIYSASKSKHHLFRNNNPSITRILYKDVECRGYNHQSVVPPSVHKDGKRYVWETELIKYSDIPLLPKNLALQLEKYKKQNHEIIKPSSMRIPCIKCKNQFFINKKRFNLEIECLHIIGQKWMCNKCRPYDLREMCRKIKSSKAIELC